MLKREGVKSTPYASTILIIGLLIWLHVAIFRLAFNLPDNFFDPFILNNKKLSRWLNTIVFLTPTLLILILLFRKVDLESYKFSEDELKKCKRNFFTYFIIIFSVVIVLLIIKGVKKGSITF